MNYKRFLRLKLLLVGKDLKIDDKLVTDEGLVTILKINYIDRKYLIYV